MSSKKIIAYNKTSDDLIKLKNKDNISDDIDYMFDKNNNLIKDDKPYLIIKSDDDNNKNSDDASDNSIIKQLQKEYIKRFKAYIKRLKYRLKQDINKLSDAELSKIIIKNNADYLETYIYLNQRCYNLIDKNTKNDYLVYLSRAITNLQMDNILKYIVANKITIEEFLNQKNISTSDLVYVISKEDLEDLKVLIKEHITTKDNIDTKDKELKEFINDFNLSDIEFLLKDAIYDLTYQKQENILNQKITNNLKYYQDINKYYKQIDKLLIDLRDKYQTKRQKAFIIDNTDDIKDIKQPINKTYPLIAQQLFSGIYGLNKEYNLNNYNRHKDPINITINIDEDNLNDFSSLPILADLYNNNNQIALLPIDLPLFMAFTQLNNTNGGNIPITLEDAFLNIVENKEVRLRKSNKSYNIYIERMLYLDRLKLTYKIVNAKTKEIIGYLKDPTSLLANSRYELNNGSKTAYIIGASAVLTLINDINKLYGIDFMASYKLSAEFINDKQNNDIEILNMKYYILPSILTRVNSKKRLDTRQPLINLENLYNQTAILKGKIELNTDDKKTLHNQINTFLNYLVKKNLISDYSYASDKNKMLSVDNLKPQKQRNIKYLKIK